MTQARTRSHAANVSLGVLINIHDVYVFTYSWNRTTFVKSHGILLVVFLSVRNRNALSAVGLPVIAKLLAATSRFRFSFVP